jgi:hypothetical protein
MSRDPDSPYYEEPEEPFCMGPNNVCEFEECCDARSREKDERIAELEAFIRRCIPRFEYDEQVEEADKLLEGG